MVRGEDNSSSQFDKSAREELRGNERLLLRLLQIALLQTMSNHSVGLGSCGKASNLLE
jgi:hypothetical protein